MPTNPPAVPEPKSSKDFSLPKKYSSLMPPDTQSSLNEISKPIAQTPDLSIASSVSDFLAQKTLLHRSRMEYLNEYERGLRETLSSNQLSHEDYHHEMERLDESYAPIMGELDIILKQRRTLGLDIQEAYEDSGQKHRNASPEHSIELMERVYTSRVAEVLSVCEREKWYFNQSEFRRRVIEYLNARHPEESGAIWCHLTGWAIKDNVKTAHLVPKTLCGEELAYLFGVDEVVLSDPRNGITLYYTIEWALDSGDIVIVPVLPSNDSGITTWKCLLVNDSIRNKMYASWDNEIKRWGELDGKDLVFRSENRPARRYLYLRYVIAYLHARKEGNRSWTEKVDNRTVFWATPGPWVEESTLLSLGRNISGFELPSSVYAGNTFKSTRKPEPVDENQNRILCTRVRKVIVVSLEDKEKEDEEEDEDDD